MDCQFLVYFTYLSIKLFGFNPSVTYSRGSYMSEAAVGFTILICCSRLQAAIKNLYVFFYFLRTGLNRQPGLLFLPEEMSSSDKAFV